MLKKTTQPQAGLYFYRSHSVVRVISPGFSISIIIIMSLLQIKDWAPFKIDALGLVTILGATEVDISVGRLVHNCIAEWLPLLGAYTVASGQISKPIPGFYLYNISDGIMATDLSSWLTRWLLSYPLTYSATILKVRPIPRALARERRLAAFSVGFAISAVLTTLAAVTKDFWGLANVLSMVASIIIRKALVHQNQEGVNIAVNNARKTPDDVVKLFITLPSGKAVTLYSPRRIVLDCFLTDPVPPQPRLYWTLRIIGWISFATHIISLGMTSLFNQILSVFVLAASSTIAVLQIGDCHNLIGSQLDFDISTGDPKETRTLVYARLDLNEDEENSMIQWNMFPHRTNKRWWQRYRGLVATRLGSNTYVTTPSQQLSRSQDSSHSQHSQAPPSYALAATSGSASLPIAQPTTSSQPVDIRI